MINSVYCWTSTEIDYYITDKKERQDSIIDFEDMRQIFLEDKDHIKVIGINNKLKDVEFFIINIDLIFYYRKDSLVLLKESEKYNCW